MLVIDVGHIGKMLSMVMTALRTKLTSVVALPRWNPISVSTLVTQTPSTRLPIIDDLETGWELKKRPRLVVLGTGWAATSVVKNLRKAAFQTIVISPTNYFLFTPLLPEATTGTVESRSLLESTRKICRRSGARYIQSSMHDIDFNNKMIRVTDPYGVEFGIRYDKLVVAVGARNETYGIPGVLEHTFFLKNIQDARRIRDKITALFEQASFPAMTQEERSRLLSFVIVGGGPTGVEFAAELYDYLNQDIIKYFPDLLRSSVRVRIIQGADHILNTFDEAISKYTETRFARQNIEVVVNAFVVKVEKDVIVYKQRNVRTGEFELHTIPYGLCVWSTGIGMLDVTKKLAAKLEPQTNARALSVDSHLRLNGIDDVYALGDCATIQTPKTLEYFEKRVPEGTDKLDLEEFDKMIKDTMETYPQTRSQLVSLREELVKPYRSDEIPFLDINTIKKRLREMGAQDRNLPATAQVASQQGHFLAKKLNRLSGYELQEWRQKEDTMKPFRYNHLGSFSYVGAEAAVFDSGKGWASGGFSAFVLWRSAYLSRQVSLRTRVLLAWDWFKTYVFGRDLSKI